MADIVMPQMGESIVEGTLTRWLKKVGDKVERDEPLFEISTDKVDTEIPAPEAGILSEILVQEGATVAINTIVGRIGGPAGAAAPPAEGQGSGVRVQGSDEPSKAPPPAAAPPPAQAPAAPAPAAPAAAAPAPAPPPAAAPKAPVAAEDQGPLSPLVRKMAREANIDLALVQGKGAGGRITKQDVEDYIAARSAGVAPPQSPAGTPAPAPAATVPAAAAAASAPLPLAESAKTKVEPMSMMRQRIAEHMVMSKHTSAHVTTVHRVDMTKIARLRDRAKKEFQERNGFSLTFLPFVTAAAAEALRAFPILNASIDGKNIVYHRDINIGIAVALEGGLLVPVIRNADERNVAGLQRAIVDLATRARSRQLKPDEVQGGTFSITNFGSFGSIFATPVINQPQVAILGVGAVEKVPAVVEGDAIAIRSQAHLALTFDHRLIDGALGDQFCQKVKSILEGWSAEIH